MIHRALQVVDWCREREIDLVTIGPEVPLVAGLADALRQAGIKYEVPRPPSPHVPSIYVPVLVQFVEVSSTASVNASINSTPLPGLGCKHGGEVVSI